MLDWVFFRAANPPQALDYLGTLFGLRSGDPRTPRVVPFSDAEIWTAIACRVIGSAPRLPRVVAWWKELPVRGIVGLSLVLEYASVGALALVFLNCAMKLASGSYGPFLYFRF